MTTRLVRFQREARGLQRLMSPAGIVLIVLAALAATACVKVASSTPNLPAAEGAAQVEPDRADCNAIFGTAFQSTTEREWYQQNCSKWPPVQVPETAPSSTGTQSAPQNQQTAAQCAQMRGRPYESSAQRDWYLQNCQGQTASAQGTPAAGQGGSDPQQPIRNSCDEIRGTPYRSPAEQQWYQQHCGANSDAQAGAPSGDGGGDSNQSSSNNSPSQSGSSGRSSTCAQIQARGYRNSQERNYYLRYCR